MCLYAMDLPVRSLTHRVCFLYLLTGLMSVLPALFYELM
jgi:hypothetical protein